MTVVHQGRAAGSTLRQPSLVSRQDWLADESLRLDPSGGERWPRETEPLREVVLHHTKTPNSDRDSAARVRAIYEFHAAQRGWGDIGYHLVVDEAGIVFEGRAGTAELLDGGPAVVGGHVYGHNEGTVGIAMLGTLFEQPPSRRAWTALVEVLAWLAYRHNLDPLGAGGASLTIRAHCDLAPTTCPGAASYELLPTLRAQVAAAVSGWPGQTGVAAR
ncbi:MAG: peptidoglycan recognition protein family protein [Actinomycetes bacterium]